MSSLQAVLYLYMWLNIQHLAGARGPHHPRGAKVVKRHVHYRPTKNSNEPIPKITQDMDLLHDKEHLKEDAGQWLSDKDLSTMTEDELEFHYFKIHDFDNNTMLDGLEILQAIHHTNHHKHDDNEDDDDDDDDDETGLTVENKLLEEFNYYVDLIDRVLAEDDLDKDGFLSYPEYVLGRLKDPDFKKYAPLPGRVKAK